MKIRKGACIETLFMELPWAARFKAAKAAGFDCVEFWSWTNKDLGEVKALSDEAGLAVSGFNGDADFSLVDPAHKKDYLDFLRQSIAAARKVGAPSVTIHSNALGDGGVVVNHYESLSHTVKLCAMFDTLRDCVPLAESGGVTLHLEALNVKTDHVGNFLVNTAMAAEICRLIGSPKLKILYDAYHMQLNEGDICGNIAAYFDQIGHIHVADAPGRHEPGTGEINYAAVFSLLDRLGYKGVVGYELFPKNGTNAAVKAIMNQ